MPRIGDFGAYVSVNKQALPAYGVQVNEKDKIVTFFIPATQNQNFTVNWTCSKDITWTSCGDLTIDGVSVGGMTLKPREHKARYRRLSCMAEMGFAENPDEPFRFGRCDLPLEASKDGMGKIRLDIYLIPDIGQAEASNPAFKCLLVCPWEDSTRGARWKYQKDAPLNRIQRMATFIIKYRSENILRQTGQNPSTMSIRLIPAHELPERSVNDIAVKIEDEEIPGIAQGLENLHLSQYKGKARNIDSPSRKRERPDEQDTSDEVAQALLSVEIEDAKKHLRQLMAQQHERKRPKISLASSQKLSFPSQQAQMRDAPKGQNKKKKFTRAVAELKSEVVAAQTLARLRVDGTKKKN